MYPQKLDRPDDIKELKDEEESVEDVVSREHVNVLLSSIQGRVEDAGGEEVAPKHSGNHIHLP